jgi:hypothetical protein
VNIENNRRASRKLGRRDDPKLFSNKGNGNKKEGDRSSANKKPKDDKMDQVLTMLKGLKAPATNVAKMQNTKKPRFTNTFNR